LSKNQCFKTKEGTTYALEVKKCLILSPKWEEVYPKLSELLGETITKLGHSKDYLLIDYDELTKEENRKLFKLDGQLRSNTKKAKKLYQDYLEILDKVGLSGFMELRDLNFVYGVMRMRGQNLSSFRTSEHEIYFKADFDLAESSNGMVEPITEIQYEEKYLSELKKRENAA
jgi:hypothetical protein